MMKGNEKDCICEKPKGKHRKSRPATVVSFVVLAVHSAHLAERRKHHGLFPAQC